MTVDPDPGRAGLGNPRLIGAIVEEMAGGVMPFDRFMELALYHPEHGYYLTPGRVGPQGDFVTSPTIHPMFGWMVAAWCHWVWTSIGEPSQFSVVEPGAGSGQLATAILDWATGRDDGFSEALRYVAIEPHNPGDDTRVAWDTGLSGPVDAGVVVSNEFFDALPVKLFEGSGRGPTEIGVRWDGEAFAEATLSVSAVDEAPEAGRFEVNPSLFGTMQALGSLIGSGAVLTFDYGYPRDELWASWRREGTLLAFYRHTAHEDPYIHVGQQDLTAHVDFTTLEAALDQTGFETFGPVGQSEFLYALGAGGLVESVRSDLHEYFRRRNALESLTDGAGLGRVRVLAGTKGLSGSPPGFEA